MDLENQRREYRYGKLQRNTLSDVPVDQFSQWLQAAVDAEIQDPTAMCVATVDSDGRPSQRTVLLKNFDQSGLVFFTNLGSRKAEQMKGNDAVSLHFSWLEVDRQVCVEGHAEKLGVTAVLKYFMSRPRESQLAAWSSQQSRKLSSRTVLDDEYQRMRQKFFHGEIPLPSFWGGFKVVPNRWEFWQGGEHRLHDRFCYTKLPQGWSINRIAP